MSAHAPLQIHDRLLARNTLANLLGQVLPLLLAVGLMPWIIRGLGQERFGILALAWMVLGYFSELGVGRATTKFVAEVLGTREEKRLASIVWATVSVQAVFGLLGAAALAAATPLLVSKVLRIPPELVGEARIGFYLLALAVPAILVSSAFRGILEAAQRFDLINLVRVPTSSATFLVPLIGLLVGWKLPGILALLLGARAAMLLAFYWLAVAVFPVLRRLPSFSRAELGNVVGFGSWITLSTVLSPVVTYLDRFMLGTLATMSAVAYYAAPYELVTRLWIIPTSVVATLFPAFSTLGGQGHWDRLEQLVSRSVKYVLLILGPAVVLLIASGRDLLDLWLGADFASASTLALQILAVGVLVNSVAQVFFSLVQGVGRPDLTAKFHLLQVPLQILLAWLLVGRWGIPGAAAAWTLRVCFDAVLLFVAATRLSPVSARSLFAERVPHAAGLLLVMGILATTAMSWLPLLWLRAAVLAASVLPVVLVLWRYGLAEADRAQLVRVLPLGGGR